jgi:hypothetical protein
MKDNLPYFSHDNNARRHPKMKALKTKYGLEGYARFWMLNERIAEAPDAFIDISKKVNKLDLASELDLDENGLEKFLEFLSDPEIDLINITDNKISTDRITELFSKLTENRERERDKKQRKKEKEHIPQGNDDFPEGIPRENEEFPGENADFPQENDTDQIRSDKTRSDKTKKDSCGSSEPPQSLKDALVLADLLFNLHKKEVPNYHSGKDTEKIISNWAVDIELLIRGDEKSPDVIRQVIEWAKAPGCWWFPNIQSGSKLRKQFETLYSQMINDSKKQGKLSQPHPHKIAADNIPDDKLDEFF